MKTPNVSRAVKLCGTEQPDVVGRLLRAGPLTVELDNGALRYLRVNGVEAVRALAFLVRDENWGTYVPSVSKLHVDQREDGFSVSYHAEVSGKTGAGKAQSLAFDITIEGRADGSLDFTGTATPATDFLTARTGFVVLHPLKGVVGRPLEIEHVDGSIEKSRFPELVDPIQPFLNIRSLTHEVLPGVKATVRMEGDTWEMEDHRNWTDASFKTYVRPLSLPWPYTLKAGEVVKQSLKFSLSGKLPKAGKGGGARSVEIHVGAAGRETMPDVGLGVPPEEIEHAIKHLDLLKLAAPHLLICHFDLRRKHGLAELYGYRVLCEQTGADAVLEVVVETLNRYQEELASIARLVKQAGLTLSAVAVCPVGDLMSVLPSGERPPAPPLELLYNAARKAFPGVKIGGGMFSNFTELNRKRPPAHLLDFVSNTTCPTVHATDDRSVMETLEALPYQVTTARTFIGKTPYRVGPSSIGNRYNPHGKAYGAWTPNPDNQRMCLSKIDPRTRALFGAAWTLGYIASFARSGVEAVSLGAPTGPLGIVARRIEHAQPYFDEAGASVYPAFHIVTGLTRAAGAKLVKAQSSDSQKVECVAYRARGATLVWVANLTADDQSVTLAGHEGATMFASMLDEDSFVKATAEPRAFQSSWKPARDGKLKLKPYAVAVVCVNDD